MTKYTDCYTHYLSDWVKADPTLNSCKHLVQEQIKPHVFNRTICAAMSNLSEKAKCELYLKHSFLTNSSSVSYW